ncbi:MAG: zinc-binding dehydrogenase [Alphaproteobacteria bacterium]|nr:zinc-binding dehydrogenase [Alphaproteobacteria bacterium]
MNYIEITEEGGPEVLQMAERAVPQPAAGEVLIKVACTALNRADLLQRKGKYPPPPGASPVLGLEVSGIVAAIGEGVKRYEVGDRVCALLDGGGYAEYAVAPAGQCLPLASTVSYDQAAALPEGIFTVWANVFEAGGLKPDGSVLIHGGASGIGTIGISMARLHGARVFTTAGSDTKCKTCEQRGADRAINYNTEDFVQVVREQTQDRGVDVVFDILGGDYVARNIQVLAPHGRHVSIAMQLGRTGQVDLLRVMFNQLVLTGSTLRHRSAEEKARIAGVVERQIWPWVSTGLLKPLIYKKFRLSEAGEAHKVMESGQHSGKIVLEVAAL